MKLLINIIIGILLVTSFGCTMIQQKQPDVPKEIIGRDGASMVLIPAGEFRMGSDYGDPDEQPVHSIYLDAFYIDVKPVTNLQYSRFMDATKQKPPVYWDDPRYNAPDHPVVGVSWEDARAYARWADKRLPTEAEWEKAARGGLVGKTYFWGDQWPPPERSGNFYDETAKGIMSDRDVISNYSDGHIYTSPVGNFRPNGYGLYDIDGNVYEWCVDWYSVVYYSPLRKNDGLFYMISYTEKG